VNIGWNNVTQKIHAAYLLDLLLYADSCDKLFELFNAFAAENTKKKPQVWPLQMMLLVLCPVSQSRCPLTDDI